MKYPGNANKAYHATINYKNRGMSLEEDINLTNTYYLNCNKAIIYKKPTPITIAKVEYNSKKERIIKEAYFKIPSTTDYNGIYKGKYIDFEAKETKLKYFPLINIHNHQIEHLKKVDEHGAIAFLIVRFSTLNETYYLDIKDLTYYLDNVKKSFVSYDYFKEHGYKLEEKFNPRLDYLKIIDNATFALDCKGISKKQRQEIGKDWLKRFGLDSMENRLPHTLSGGEAQRVSLVRTLIAEPKVAPLRKKLTADLSTWQKELGFTAILVTHDIEEAKKLGDKIIVMKAGKMIWEGKPEDFSEELL